MQRSGRPPRGRPAPPRRQENPRRIALNILQDVTRADAYASLALGKRLRESSLQQRDRDLVTELVYGTLERKITLDYWLNQRLERPDVEPLVRDILRMGVYQIIYLTRVPDSAAVDESVKLAREMDRVTFAGLVNGVLRGIARDKESLPQPGRDEQPALHLSVSHSLPLWLAERLIDAYGYDEAEQIASYRPEERRITIRRTPGMLDAGAFEKLMAQKGWTFSPARIKDAYYVTGIGDVGIDKEFLRGIYSVQGEGSMLAAMAVAPSRAASILDACAAPGGKTACLAQAMEGTGRVYAWDIHEHRVQLLRSMVKRLRLDTVRPAVRDATIVREDLIGAMDAVLVDAPCSGLGVMLSKPDVKYRQTPETVLAMQETQRKLLDACCQYVKPGGVLVYATCTILPEENALQVEQFLRRHASFQPDEEGLCAAMPEEFRPHAKNGMLQLQAHRDRMEGFFIARMRRQR